MYSEVDRVLVIGAGAMGGGIAEVCALAGHTVILQDIDTSTVQGGYDVVRDRLSGAADVEDPQVVSDRITPVTPSDPIGEPVDVVIEAVPEIPDIKRTVLSSLGDRIHEETLVATNTSSLSVTDLSAAAPDPARFCGIHFFNPPRKMQLIELIAHDQSAPQTLETAASFAEGLDKTTITAHRDSPGFIVNRMLLPMINEAAWMLDDEGMTADQIDATARAQLGFPMGMLRLADFIGLDVIVAILGRMSDAMGAAYEPAPAITAAVDRGDFGDKTGSGLSSGAPDSSPFHPDREVEQRLIAVMAREVYALIDTEVAAAEDIDTGAELGLGCTIAPTQLIDTMGSDQVASVLQRRHESTGAARYILPSPPDGPLRSDGGVPAYDTLKLACEPPVATITLNRPSALNAVTSAMLEELDAAVSWCAADASLRAIVVQGAGDRAFSAGFDLHALSVDDISGTRAVLQQAASTFETFEEVGLPIIAAIDGVCLGGGMELAAAADLRVATVNARFGQPEVRLGLLPAWGGTRRLPAIIGDANAREVILRGSAEMPASTLAEWGFLTATASDESALDAAIDDIIADLTQSPRSAVAAAKHALVETAARSRAPASVEIDAFCRLLETPETAEGISAFREGRTPTYRSD